MSSIDMQVHGRKVHALQVIHGLSLEINTGMRLSSKGSVVAVANRITGRNDRSKKTALRAMIALMSELDPTWTASDRVAKAAAK
jgi:hypothetical protein